MGTNDLDESLDYSMMLSTILKYIKDTEDMFSNMSGLKKKEHVLQLIKENIKLEYNPVLIDVMIDSLIYVSNNPTVLKSTRNCSNTIFMCCGC